ncbi:MAG: N-acetylmuramoyl-L-alanine amidase [Erysipelotrichales bacterium]|nr:N-acetylmuramoyl-L-alanine amidase [Erysipelotrichales bacterium]
MGANLTLERLGESFAKKDRKASSNYAIDTEGRVALYVEEENRSWASSNIENDNMAVTIEVANESIGGDWRVSDKAYETLIELCTDICRRNGIPKLIYTGNKDGTLTTHNMFREDTECPGPYLESRMKEIVEKVNDNLNNF